MSVGVGAEGGYQRGREPTPEELRSGVADLLSEVDAALASNRWVILDTGSDSVKQKLYDAAALRHCCLLLKEIEDGACAGHELTVRILGRSHIEAWAFALYLHFGGYEALERIAQDTLHQVNVMNQQIAEFDQWLAQEKRKARRRLTKVRRLNASLKKWNEEHPDQRPKPLHDEPYVPRLVSHSIDLSDRIADFGTLQPQSLATAEVIDALTKLAPVRGFGRESFRPIYLIYRMLSGGATHPTLNVLDSYFQYSPGFIRTTREPGTPSIIMHTRVTALYSTAFLASWVLGDVGCSTPVADKLRTWLEPDPTGGKGWAPGG
ncbi:hypothetical protein HC028_19845 [Planosporangium flavigriseum]|uniref:Uncharacterized protein n=1 Tax=Planosporangium flavigriseum TaxID=373681 RepID=A0A8J3PN21_9ACTN|nr:DUF5677 domain-containing protein [Planosporangium flavigriseum]NJC66744.1 hypothetical protein [Planosporangium flavigriseum]GIG74899.1 hypothetical protein Pfl04_33030 [Planosporangium flavigriseum]